MSLLARLSLARRGPVALVAAAVIGLGLLALPVQRQHLSSDEDRAAFVVATYPGAAAELVDGRVVGPIEDGVRDVPGLERVTSTATEGTAAVQLEFAPGTDLGEAVGRLGIALDRIEPRLPAGVVPEVVAGRSDDVPAVVLAAVAGPAGEPTASPAGEPAASPAVEARDERERELAERLRRAVVPGLRDIEGVRRVEVTGAREPLVVVTPHRARLIAARVAPTAIGVALQAIGAPEPAGSLATGDRTLAVRTGAPIGSLDDLRALPLAVAPGAPPVRLGAVADVDRRLAPRTSLTRTDGRPSLGVTITVTPDADVVAVSRAVRDRLPGLSRALGGDGSLVVAVDRASSVEASTRGLTTAGLFGLALVVLVILVFLLSLRSALVAAVGIPLGVLVALAAMRLGDLSLNLPTAAALIIVAGRFVDDCVTVLENVKRHLGYGEGRHRAILDGVREVAGGVTASTLATIAVFAPLGLVGGVAGRLLAPFAVTVTVALLASLLGSLTVVPVLASWLLRPAGGREIGGPESGGQRLGVPEPGGQELGDPAVRRAAEDRELRGPLQGAYLPVIGFALRWRVATVLLGAAVLLGTSGLALRLTTDLVDRSGQDLVVVDQDLPGGIDLAAADAVARRVERAVASTRGVATYQVSVGRGEPLGLGGMRAPNTAARFHVTADRATDGDLLAAALRERLTPLAGIGRVTVRTGTDADRLRVTVLAPEREALDRAAARVRLAMAGMPLLTVTVGPPKNAPGIEVTVDRSAAVQRGLPEAYVGQVVAQSLRGDPVGAVTLDGRRHDVLLLAGPPPTSPAELRALAVPTASGPLPLDSIAEVAEVAGPSLMTRVDGVPAVIIDSVATGDPGDARVELAARLAALHLPAGASYAIEDARLDLDGLRLAGLAALALAFLLAAAFLGLVRAMIVAVAVPFAASGALVALRLAGVPLGLPELVGLLALAAISLANAVVLVDLIGQRRAAGMAVLDAAVDGGRRRLRPVLTTAVAVALSLLPVSLGLAGDGRLVTGSLALVMIAGLGTSTLATLVLVPALYTLVETARERLAGDRSVAQPPTGRPTPAEPDRATTATARVPAATALREKTDQFEVLRLPRTVSSTRPRDP
jgi:HAE1 family hydrophobic/amphiphilic exporter-1